MLGRRKTYLVTLTVIDLDPETTNASVAIAAGAELEQRLGWEIPRMDALELETTPEEVRAAVARESS